MISPYAISQVEYIQYKHAIEDLHVAYKCYKHDETERLQEEEGRLKYSQTHSQSAEGLIAKIKQWIAHFLHSLTRLFAPSGREAWKNSLMDSDPLFLKQRVEIINRMHVKLGQAHFDQNLACNAVAIDFYNSSLKTIQAWNRVFFSSRSSEWTISAPRICAPFQLMPLSNAISTEDERALSRYFELLNAYPEKLKRMGSLNDYKQGTYEIAYDPNEIRTIQQLTYDRLYARLNSHELAAAWSRPGVVCEDSFWIWIRDAVISPHGFKHMYNRLIWKSQLDGIGGAAVIPLFRLPDGQIRIGLILAYRHATSSWEFELPRGGSKKGETAEETAKRELQEEAGLLIDHPELLGSITPDSGVMPSIVPIFSGEVTVEQAPAHEETEAIAGKYFFSLDEIERGLADGYLTVEQKGEKQSFALRDPFLAYALLLYCIKHPRVN
ncbi:NUDIX hydrolase [Candidatus Protochlamydia phocaeensis]|uniref:NUDIX hydrolase n=1 Tax=Candidatus Protochlamydia phocaeensis TaxID=1414722 RepID=UPI00083839F5|nr:NUDIX hydrolase [Candidatus Protochlamydia phocaeensis]